MLSCGMVRFPTGHYWHCSPPVKKVSPGICPCKRWTFWTLFANKLFQIICIFHVFLVQVASIHRVSFLLCWCLMVDRPAVQSFKLVKDSEGTKRKLLIFCIVLIFALILTTFGISFICWIDDIKSHFETCFTCMRIANFWFLSFTR